MSPRSPKQWPPDYAPRTTTSPATQALLEDAMALLEGHVAPQQDGMIPVNAAGLEELLGELRRLQEHESRLRQDLEGTFELTRLLYSSRGEARYHARILAHAYRTDNRPPEASVLAALAFPVGDLRGADVLEEAPAKPTGRHQEATVIIGDDPPSRRKLTEVEVAKLRRFWDRVRPGGGTGPAQDTDNERG